MPGCQKYAWMPLFAIAALFALSGLYVLFAGLDESDVQGSTGMSVEEITAFNPAVVDYMQRLERLLGVAWVGVTVLAAAVVWSGAHGGGARASWYALWAFAGMLFAASATFFVYESAGLGAFYLAGGVLTAAMLGLSYRRFA